MPRCAATLRAASCAAAAFVSGAAPTPLYGLALMHNSPAQSTLVRVDQTSGDVTIVGPPLGYPGLLDATGDLTAVDTKRNLLYYLGDSTNGTTLVGVDLTSGNVRCTANLPLREIGFVGFGQSLNFDVGRDELIVSGIITNATTNVTSHYLYTGPAAGCGPFAHIGTFGDADYMPMLHASAYDASARVMYMGLATGSNTVVIGVIGISKGSMNVSVPEDPDTEHILVGMKWDASTKTLVGLESTPDYTGLLLVQLSPLSGKWTVTPMATQYPVVMGNMGEVSAFDSAQGKLYGLLAANTTSMQNMLARVDVKSATVEYTAPLQSVGLGLLNNLVFPNEQ